MKKSRISLLFEQILIIPDFAWILLVFLISYFTFFIIPLFLLPQQMQFPNYIPVGKTIGMDLSTTLSFTNSWFIDNQYVGNYPPFFRLFFAPLTLIPFYWAYRILTLLTLFCYVGSTFGFPLLIDKYRRISPLLILISVTGLLSYGLQFELERGQFNVIAIFLCFLSIWIFHYHSNWSYLAYFFFTISVQLKIFPIIFIVMFVKDWKNWKENIKTFFVLFTTNFTSLFIFGPKVFNSFINGIIEFSKDHQVWAINHSVFSFVSWFINTLATIDHRLKWATDIVGIFQKAVVIFVVILFLLVLLKAYQQNNKGINSKLLLACTISALLIPSVSHDYTLALLPGPIAIFLGSDEYWKESGTPVLRVLKIVVLISFSALYASTLFSYATKPMLLQNNFISLFLMLMIITILSFVTKTNGATSELHPK